MEKQWNLVLTDLLQRLPKSEKIELFWKQKYDENIDCNIFLL